MGNAREAYHRWQHERAAQQMADLEATSANIRRLIPEAIAVQEQYGYPDIRTTLQWQGQELGAWPIGSRSAAEEVGYLYLLENGKVVYAEDWDKPTREVTFPYGDQPFGLQSVESSVRGLITRPKDVERRRKETHQRRLRMKYSLPRRIWAGLQGKQLPL